MRFVVMRRGDDAGRAFRVPAAIHEKLVAAGEARDLTADERAALNAGDRDMRFTVGPDSDDDAIQHVGGGMYELPTGDRVKGKDAALARLAELKDPSTDSPPDDDT